MRDTGPKFLDVPISHDLKMLAVNLRKTFRFHMGETECIHQQDNACESV
jgi:hypothetical protein